MPPPAENPTPPVAEDAAEAEAWQAFVRTLGEQLAAEWPAMPERLGDRWPGFVALAAERALSRGLAVAAGVARYVNLSVVWGPAFEERAGFEWAESILATGHADWLRAHQLMQRSLAELARRPDARIRAEDLAGADTRLIARFADHGRHGALHPPEPPALPLRACDLERVELRVLAEGGPRRVQLAADGEWRREETPLPAPLRLDAAAPWPARLHAPGRLDGEPPLRLQLRAAAHAVCDADHHPAVALAGPRERLRVQGHESKAFSAPLPARPPQPAPAGPGTLLAEETSPELYRVEFETCGLRDEGAPLGPRTLPLAAWPRTQWWVEWQRTVPAAQSLLPGPRPWTPGTTRGRVERDGVAADAEALRRAFAEGLDGAVAAAVQRLADAWAAVDGLAKPGAEIELGVLTGRFAAAWGWQFAATLDAAPTMRLVARAALEAVHVEALFGGELDLDGARSRVQLRLQGRVALEGDWRHEGGAGAPPLAPWLLARAQQRFRLPFALQLDPLASDAAALLQAAAPVRGALVGEAGLRPNTHGGAGWEWFVALRLEPVVALLEREDPLLGRDRFERTLLPGGPLLDWSLG